MAKSYTPKLNYKDESTLANEKRKMKVECPNCRHLINFYAFEKTDKKLCTYCKIYVFKNKKDEFDYRLREAIKSENTN